MFDYTIVTCGTAGHVFPALCLIKSLLNKNFKVCLIIDSNAFEKFKDLINNYKNLFVITTIPFYFNYKCIFSLFKNIKKTWKIIKNSKLIIGFIAGLQIPTLITTILLNKKFILHEQDSILNKTNSIFAYFALNIYTSFKEVKTYNFLKKKLLWSGCPIEVLNNLEKKYDLLFNKRKIIVIFAGTNGSKFIDEIIPKELIKIPNINDYIIYHNCKKDNIKNVEDFYKNNNITAKVSNFFENFESLYKHSDLLITRAGASTISYINYYKKKAILIPWPNSSQNHQYFNAKLLENKNFIEILEENNINNIHNKITGILNNPENNIYSQNVFKTINANEYIYYFM